ncbi:MAG TPA: nucleotidyl transferase AbiEii/AbiGii toxin family protein [Clostridia bacterium]|nr:nucleotidyl transferase AbiEii/AbiGii toxin family protein [Clostridia bacterium]
MSKEIKDMSASVRTRLLTISKSQGKPFDQIMILYMLERLLYRLSISKYRPNFILKGGLLLYVLAEEKSRPTKDIDFLARQISNEINNIAQVFIDICQITCNDGLKFDGENIIAENIKEDADNQGVRVRINCYLGQAKKTLQIDIGFGDIIIPKAEEMDYPTILEMDCPDILVYSVESVIAEKFEAMVSLAQANSRLKRFDKGIYYIPKMTAFGPSKLNPMQVFIETYIKKGMNVFGYETGPSLLNQMGLTAQIPKYRYFATNRYQRYGDHVDTKLKVVLRRSVMNISVETRPYLQLLDALENKDKTPIDAENAQEQLARFAVQNNIDFRKLIAYAKKYYTKEVIWQIAELAASMENEPALG